MTPDQIRWLTWGAMETRRETHGCAPWDEPGTHKAIAELCGTWGLNAATEHVLAHARDPKARTPYATKGTAPTATAPTHGAKYPAKAGSPDECRLHLGQYAATCSGCAADRLVGDPTPARSTPASNTSQHVARLRSIVHDTLPRRTPAP